MIKPHLIIKLRSRGLFIVIPRMKLVVYNNINFKIGENAEDNWKIIQSANKDYYWVHADGVSSAHIIIEIDIALQDEIKFACIKCKEVSKNVTDSTRFVVTQIKNIKLGSKPGEVYFKDDKQCKYYTI